MKSSTYKSHQRGLTLVEIMVALVISLFLLAGLLQLFISTRQSSRIQENLSRVQENGRFAIEYVGRVIRLAGYRSGGTIRQEKAFEEAFSNKRFQGGVQDGNDFITVRFEGENAAQGEIRNCLNQLINASTVSSDTLRVVNNTLQCSAVVTPPGGAPQTQPVVDGVESMQIFYGETIGGNLRYVPAADVSNWNNIFSSRIILTLRTPEDNLADAIQPEGDRRLRRVFTTTVALRN